MKTSIWSRAKHYWDYLQDWNALFLLECDLSYAWQAFAEYFDARGTPSKRKKPRRFIPVETPTWGNYTSETDISRPAGFARRDRDWMGSESSRPRS